MSIETTLFAAADKMWGNMDPGEYKHVALGMIFLRYVSESFQRLHDKLALPGQLFYGTQIPACLWILAKDKSNGVAKDAKLRDRRGEVLFIDARKMGALVPGSRKQKELSRAEIEQIASTYHAWRGEPDAGAFEDVAGFCKSATTEEIAKHNFVLTPGRYVGAGEVEDDGEPFEEKFTRLMGALRQQFAEGQRLETEIENRLGALV